MVPCPPGCRPRGGRPSPGRGRVFCPGSCRPFWLVRWRGRRPRSGMPCWRRPGGRCRGGGPGCCCRRWLAVHFTLALCLLACLPYQDALRSLAGDGAAGLAVPASTALTAARRRLGDRPLELLFWRVAGVLLPSRDPWATVRGLLVVAWDGTTLKAPASPENIAAFGRPRGGGRKPGGGKAPPVEGHYPHVRVVALIACGTRALLGAAIGPLADGEQKLAAALTGCLGPGMLLLADRGFWSCALWRACSAAGADLLWRGARAPGAALTGCLGPGMLLLADRGFWSCALWRACSAAGADLLWRVKSDIR